MAARQAASPPERSVPDGASPRVRFGRQDAAAFHADPLEFFVSRFAQAGAAGPVDALWYAPRRLCVAEAGAARQVLGNRDGEYADTSDFFFTRDGVAGPRSAQLAIARSARVLVEKHLDAHREDLPVLVERVLGPGGGASRWPDAGNRLMDAHLRPVLLHHDADPATHALLDEIIERAVLAGARDRHSKYARMLLRRRIRGTLAAEAARRERDPAPADAPRDLFDVVLAGGLDGPLPQVLEVYQSFLFALVGALGFALGWAVFLVAAHPGSERAEPSRLVREALRLWPVAWLFERAPIREHRTAGEAVGPSDRVNVCTYLVHRDPRHWDRPEQFEPERWAEARGNPAYLPFGYGPHSCPGANAATSLLRDLLRLILTAGPPRVAALGSRPYPGPALAPASFTLTLSSTPTP